MTGQLNCSEVVALLRQVVGGYQKSQVHRLPIDSDKVLQAVAARLKDLGDQDGWLEFFETCWWLIYAVARRAGLGDAEATLSSSTRCQRRSRRK